MDKELVGPFYEVIRHTVGEAVPKITRVYLSEVLDAKDTWKVGRSTIIGLTGLQKIADKEGIVEKRFEHCISPSKDNRQQHAVNIWVGFRGDMDPDNWKRGSGEASELNTGEVIVMEDGTRKYDTFSKIDSKYRYSMADKRAFARAMIKLLRLYGVYSEVESSDFYKETTPRDDGSELDF